MDSKKASLRAFSALVVIGALSLAAGGAEAQSLTAAGARINAYAAPAIENPWALTSGAAETQMAMKTALGSRDSREGKAQQREAENEAAQKWTPSADFLSDDKLFLASLAATLGLVAFAGMALRFLPLAQKDSEQAAFEIELRAQSARRGSAQTQPVSDRPRGLLT